MRCVKGVPHKSQSMDRPHISQVLDIGTTE